MLNIIFDVFKDSNTQRDCDTIKSSDDSKGELIFLRYKIDKNFTFPEIKKINKRMLSNFICKVYIC